MFWLPPGGQDNEVWADTWVILAELESADAAPVLALLQDADVGAYIAGPSGRRGATTAGVQLYVDREQHNRAVDVVMQFLRGKDQPAVPVKASKPAPEGAPQGQAAVRPHSADHGPGRGRRCVDRAGSPSGLLPRPVHVPDRAPGSAPRADVRCANPAATVTPGRTSTRRIPPWGYGRGRWLHGAPTAPRMHPASAAAAPDPNATMVACPSAPFCSTSPAPCFASRRTTAGSPAWN